MSHNLEEIWQCYNCLGDAQQERAASILRIVDRWIDGVRTVYSQREVRNRRVVRVDRTVYLGRSFWEEWETEAWSAQLLDRLSYFSLADLLWFMIGDAPSVPTSLRHRPLG